LTTKIHLAALSEDVAIGIALSSGNEADCQYYAPLQDQARCQVNANATVLDKGYDSDAIRYDIREHGQQDVIPSRSNRKQQWDYDRELYKQRNRIERLINKLKHFRAVATRYQKLSNTFLALVLLALSILIVRFFR